MKKLLLVIASFFLFIGCVNAEIKTYDRNSLVHYGVNKKWEIPLLAGGFYHVEYNLQDNNLVSKSIIYITTGGSDIYLPFRFDSDSSVNNLIHEILHLIKG